MIGSRVLISASQASLSASVNILPFEYCCPAFRSFPFRKHAASSDWVWDVAIPPDAADNLMARGGPGSFICCPSPVLVLYR